MRKPARLPLEALASYLAACHPPDAPIDWKAWFGDDRPVEIEIGSGKGTFLIAAAEEHPATNFLGVEVLRGLQLYIATRIAKRKLANVRVMCADARRLMHQSIPEGSVQAIHVYFPDPWWKKRHHKRRLWTAEFAADCVRALRPGGKLLIGTDVSEYYVHIRALLDDLSELRRVCADEKAGDPGAAEHLTNFERKARQRGGSVYRAEYERLRGTDASSSILHAQ